MKSKFSTRILAFVLMMALVVPMLVFSASAEDTVIEFALGADGSATHKDNNTAKTTYSETVDGYTLSITGGNKMYPGSIDAKGNGCIKFGSSSAVGSCTFTVPNDVTSVVLHVAKYKANATKINVNGTAYTLSGASNDGAYDKITVDTTSTKTVSFTTVSGGVRAMLNQIDFVIASSGGESGGESGEPSISVSIAGNSSLRVEESIALSATVEGADGEVEWTTSDASVATVDAAGNVTGVALGKATITASFGEVTAEKEITVYPKNNSELTIADAIKVATYTGDTATADTYKIVGVIEKIDTAYSAQYNNISVTINDGTGSIKVFRTKGGETLLAGQTIAVCGKLRNYEGKNPQVDTGSEHSLVLDESAQAIVNALNEVEAKMSLAYTYETAMENVPVSGEATDVLDNAFTDVTGTTYTTWSGKAGASGAVYAGTNAGANSSIQLNNNDKKPGVVTTVSGGKVKSITITWNDATSDNRVLYIYGKDTAYTAATDLYSDSTKGTLITSLTYVKGADPVTYVFEDEYEFIAIQSKSGAQYLASISIEWETGSSGDETVEMEVYSNSEFAFRFGADEALATLGATYGLMVSAGDKVANYTTLVQDGGYCYVTVGLGDIINDKTKLSTQFTVRAYVEIDGVQYVSSEEATYSVVDMITYYYETENITAVEHLYNYLTNNG